MEGGGEGEGEGEEREREFVCKSVRVHVKYV